MGGMSVCRGVVVVVGASFSEALSGLSLVILLRYQLDLVLVLVSIFQSIAAGLKDILIKLPAAMDPAQEVKPVYIFIKSSVSKSYKTKLSLCLGMIQLVLSAFMWIALSILPVGHLYISPIFFFISALLSVISSQRPNYSIVICTLALSMMSILCSFCLVVYFGTSLNRMGGNLASVAFFAANLEMIVSITSFSMCCQSLCCGQKGYSRDNTQNQSEGQMEPMVDMTFPSLHAPNTAERVDSMSYDDYGFMNSSRSCSATRQARERQQRKENQVTQAQLMVQMPPSPSYNRHVADDLPTYADVMTSGPGPSSGFF